MASPGNRHCASCIGTLSSICIPLTISGRSASVELMAAAASLALAVALLRSTRHRFHSPVQIFSTSSVRVESPRRGDGR